MFDITWANKERWRAEQTLPVVQSELRRHEVKAVLNLRWEEHCVECAVPDCYSSCTLYEPRRDKACERFRYGIYPNLNFIGHYNFGADIRFKKWGKLEAELTGAFQRPLLNHGLLQLAKRLPRSIKNRIIYAFEESYPHTDSSFDYFVLECHSPQEEKFRLILEHFQETATGRKTRYRTSFDIHHGHNIFSVAFKDFNMTELAGFIYVFPEDAVPEKRLIFTWLDFVKTDRELDGFINTNKEVGNPKVKCVAWDLDGTLWSGILSEDPSVELNHTAVDVIREFNKRGILQSIISKNDFDIAWNKLREFGITDYILFPKINWEPKSINLESIARDMNIDINSVAVVDDSHFERAEINSRWPQVRTYSPTDLTTIVAFPEFDHPVTETSRQRTLLYKTEMERAQLKIHFSDNIDNFIRSCQMDVRLFVPHATEDRERCLELIQRSNQLNLSSKRYTRDEFEAFVRNENILPIAIRCTDRFGDYGLIGFAAVEFANGEISICEFLLSCRAAQKKIEETFIKCISEKIFNAGFRSITIPLNITLRNMPLQTILQRMCTKVAPINKSRTNFMIEQGKLTFEGSFMNIIVDREIEIYFDLVGKNR